MIKILFFVLGFVSLALGIIGIMMPVLPTTPFLLLTLYAFSKSSNRFHQWFINTKIYDKYLKTYVEKKAMTRKQKWRLMIGVDIILLISFFMVDTLTLKLLIVTIDLIKYVYFLKK